MLWEYPSTFMSKLVSTAQTTSLVGYTLYAVEAEDVPANNALLLTIPFVAFGLFRYLYLLNTSPDAEFPERLVTRDMPFLISVVSWIVAVMLVLVLNS